MSAAQPHVLAVASYKVLYEAVATEDEEVVDELVKEVSVVGYDDERASELLEVLLKNIQCDDVEVVCRLVEDQQVRLLHQDCQKVESSLLTTAEFLDLIVEHLVWEEETVQEPGVVHYVKYGVIRIK